MDERLIDIETKLAYQEDLIQELNRIVSTQQQEISGLRRLCDELAERLRSLSESLQATGHADERPPHY